MRTGNGAGDGSPAFDRRHGVVLMAQLENIGGQGGPFVAQGDISVSRSTDGGVNWSEPTTVFQGQGAGIGPANQAVFYDKSHQQRSAWNPEPLGTLRNWRKRLVAAGASTYLPSQSFRVHRHMFRSVRPPVAALVLPASRDGRLLVRGSRG
jgi:hypothetical protein